MAEIMEKAAATEAATTPVISVRGVTVDFPLRRGNFRAVEDVSFDIMPGEVLGVVGESGAGKSMTGSAIIGLIEPPGRITAGEVLLHGKRIDNLPPDEMQKLRGKRIGMVFQDPLTSLNPLYRIGDQIVETIRRHLPVSEAEARERAIGLLREAGIPSPEDRIDAYPHQFSGGMRQRVVIALALAAEPELIIADEPTSALDVSVQAQVLNLMMELQADLGLSFLFISHDMAVVERVSHNVAVMYLGRIVEIGPRAAVFENPQHSYTKSLMLAVPIADPRDRKQIGDLNFKPIPSPMHPLSYTPEPSRYETVGPGHLVLREG